MTTYLPDRVRETPTPAVRSTMKLRKKEIRKARRAKERAGRAPQGNAWALTPFSWWGGAKCVRKHVRRDRRRRA